MCAVGILYLLYEKNLVKSPGTSGEDIASPQSNYVSRTVLGIQVKTTPSKSVKTVSDSITGWPGFTGYDCNAVQRYLAQSTYRPTARHASRRLACSK